MPSPPRQRASPDVGAAVGIDLVAADVGTGLTESTATALHRLEPRLTPVFGTFWCRAELIAHTHRLLFEQHRANVRIAVYDGEDVPAA